MSIHKDSDETKIGYVQNTSELDALKAMSNTELLQEIEALLTATASEMDTNRIELCLALLQERAPAPAGAEPTTQWHKLQEEHPLLFEEDSDDAFEADETSKAERFLAKSGSRGRVRRVFRVVEGLVVAMLAVTVAASAFGINPIKAALNWAEGIIQVYSNPSGIMELPADDPSEYHSLEAALVANGIDPKDCPNWVPKDYALMLVDVKQTENFSKYSAAYESSRGELLVRVVQFAAEGWSSTEERDPDGYTYMHNDVEYYIVSNFDNSKAGWQDEKYVYVISGQISEQELRYMIDSIS